MHTTIRYGDATISFTIRFAAGARRRIALSILPDGSVAVDAPAGMAPGEVIAAVGRRARWIWLQQEAHRARAVQVLPRHYVSGESHFYLGRRYPLKLVRSDTAAPGVRLVRGRLEVATTQEDPATVKHLLDRWYRARAREVFARRIAAAAARLGRPAPAFGMRDMRTQWGSCSPAGILLLNPHLVKAPAVCVDYVIVHELCHLQEHNHSPRFYRLLAAALPDWERRKAELDDMAELLLNR